MGSIRSMRWLAFALGPVLLSLTGAAASATEVVPMPAANPCSYSINYGCGTSTGSNTRYNAGTVLVKGNYARDTDSRSIYKDVGIGGEWVSGDGDTVYFIANEPITQPVWCDSGGASPSGIVVGCNRTTS